MVDLASFEDSHEQVAHTVFHSGLLLMRGTLEARGPRRTVVGEMAWNLEEVAAARRDHGPQAALDLLGRTAPCPPAGQAAPQHTLPRRRHCGSPPAPVCETRAADLRRLGHRSPGSAG
ncbi:hypothetical protein ABT275_45055 [Streptomyces sp. NPDC001185]|uniref:hypothetical protein n=1 Tax=Streptomyces sp. NPDC001185 TaxID=3154380 RepID=UPI00331E96F2